MVTGRAHVLPSIDYGKMPAEVKAQEPAPQPGTVLLPGAFFMSLLVVYLLSNWRPA